MLLAVVLALGVVGCFGIEASQYKQTVCETLDKNVREFLAEIVLTAPLIKVSIEGGALTYVRGDGKYLEVEGKTHDLDSKLCVTLLGEYTDEEPKAHMRLLPLHQTKIGSSRDLRQRRAAEIWRVSSIPDSPDRKTFLKPFEPYHGQWGDDSLSASTKHSSSPALHVHYAKGSYTMNRTMRGAGFYSTPSELTDKVEKLILQYDIYFENFGFGNMGKLPGLFGGEKGEGAYKCSGGHNPPTCFSLRLMWHKNGTGELYAYIPKNQEEGFLDRDDVVGHSAYGQTLGRGKIHFQNGVWQTVLEQVTLNTPGHTDGSVKICNTISGRQECYTANNLLLRNDPDHYIRGLVFSTFFGGGKPADAAPNDCHTYFRNFRMSIPSGYVIG